LRVFVKNMRGEPLMPTTNRKARILLKEKKATIYCYEPFTIQLKYATGEATQEVNLGIDLGSKNIGIAITTEDTVLAKGEIELRDDVSKLIKARSILRRSRRCRKTRYRRSKFKYNTKRYYNVKKGKWIKKKIVFESPRPEGWLPPSIQSRINNTFNWIDKFKNLLPNPKLSIEVGKFDVAKMIDPSINGEDYQKGNAYGFYNTRYYVFARDNYTCQICKKKGGILQTHHIIERKNGGSDRAENLATVHKDCHEDFHQGKIKHKFTKPKLYKEPVFMNIIRLRIYKKYPYANITYGNITTVDRKTLGLPKTHYNDAIAITGIKNIKENPDTVFKIKQFRKKKRSLHEATARKGRKEPNTTQKRNEKNTKYQKGFYLNDKVKVFGKVGFISGFCNSGCYVKDISDNYITIPDKKYKQVSFKHLEFISHNNNWQFISHL